VRVTARFPDELRQRYLEIRDGRNHAVVAVIEVLSPTNKAAGMAGREAFLRKRRNPMAAPVHWVEIDLLRVGERPPEVAGLSDYYALLKRAEEMDEFAVWYRNLRDSLPVIAVPLTTDHPDAVSIYKRPSPGPTRASMPSAWIIMTLRRRRASSPQMTPG